MIQKLEAQNNLLLQNPHKLKYDLEINALKASNHALKDRKSHYKKTNSKLARDLETLRQEHARTLDDLDSLRE